MEKTKMLESEIKIALAANDVSLGLINEAAGRHAFRKQSLKDKINTIKNGKIAASQAAPTSQKQTALKQEHKTDFVEEYRDLINKIDFGFKAPDKEEANDYFRHRPPSLGLISSDLNKITTKKEMQSSGLDINPRLAVLGYADFQKIALAQKSEDITNDILRNHINGNDSLIKDFPELQETVGKLQTLGKNHNNIHYEIEEFNQVQALVLRDFNRLYPNFNKQCQSVYNENKDRTKPDIELSKYQRYCVLSGVGFIPNINRPDIRHDMESKEVLYDMTVNNLDRKPQKQKDTAKQIPNTELQEVQIIGDKNKIKKPQMYKNDIYNDMVNQELQKRLQNQQ